MLMDDLLRQQQHQANILEKISDDYDATTVYPIESGAWLFQDWLTGVGVHGAVAVVHEVLDSTEDPRLRECLEDVLKNLQYETTHAFYSVFMDNMCGYSFQKFVEEEIGRRIVE